MCWPGRPRVRTRLLRCRSWRTTVSTERHSLIDAAAGDWLAKRDSGDWTEEDQACFERWLGASTLHRVAYLRIEQVWERSARLRALGAGRTPGGWPRPGG